MRKAVPRAAAGYARQLKIVMDYVINGLTNPGMDRLDSKNSDFDVLKLSSICCKKDNKVNHD